jgi:hypothetical protein
MFFIFFSPHLAVNWRPAFRLTQAVRPALADGAFPWLFNGLSEVVSRFLA